MPGSWDGRALLPRPATTSGLVNFRPETSKLRIYLSVYQAQIMVATKAKTHSGNFRPECRVIVNDVDEDRLQARLQNSKAEPERQNSSGWENPTAKIKRFQVEAESRKLEFARLLEEHAQVISRIKQMEEKELPHVMPHSVPSLTKA